MAIVDDIAAVVVGEIERFFRPGAGGEAVFLRRGDRLFTRDAAVEIVPCDGEAAASQRPAGLVERGEAGRLLGIEAGQREDDLGLELRLLVARKGQLDAIVGRALGEQRLRAVERIDGELGPALAVRQLFLEQQIEDMVAGIALVAAKIDGAVDKGRQVGVDLDEALRLALVVIVPAPRLAGDERQREILRLGQRDMRHRPAAAFGDGGVHHRAQPVGRDAQAFAICADPLVERPGARHQPVDLGQHRIIGAKRLQVGRRAEQAAGFVGKAELLAIGHRQPRFGSSQLPQQRGLAPALVGRQAHRRDGGDFGASAPWRPSAASAGRAGQPWQRRPIPPGHNRHRHIRARARRLRGSASHSVRRPSRSVGGGASAVSREAAASRLSREKIVMRPSTSSGGRAAIAA